ncbi:hypothetical protein C1880_07865 [Senegalimassilia anaerobia]|uniref:Uncharacterized protein n=1 Tax=Senegalimassilia anaerobia TaxID=1473216 RepID=A0A369L5K7_9ACTN|nr:hypothetical protein C1880_07865 [Senegalimassilia anaerobia]
MRRFGPRRDRRHSRRARRQPMPDRGRREYRDVPRRARRVRRSSRGRTARTRARKRPARKGHDTVDYDSPWPGLYFQGRTRPKPREAQWTKKTLPRCKTPK